MFLQATELPVHVDLKLRLCLHSHIASLAIEDDAVLNELVALKTKFVSTGSACWAQLCHLPIVSAARTKLLWYFFFTKSFVMPGKMRNLCLFLRCLFEARWASHEHWDWHFTLQWPQFQSLSFPLSLARISMIASWLSFDSYLSVKSLSSSCGKSGGIFEETWVCCWAGITVTWCSSWLGGGIWADADGCCFLSFSTCASEVTCCSHSSKFFDRYPHIMQWRLILRVRIRRASWFLCFLEEPKINIRLAKCHRKVHQFFSSNEEITWMFVLLFILATQFNCIAILPSSTMIQQHDLKLRNFQCQ